MGVQVVGVKAVAKCDPLFLEEARGVEGFSGMVSIFWRPFEETHFARSEIRSPGHETGQHSSLEIV